MTVTITDTTMTTYTPAADTGSEPAAAARDWLTPAPDDQHPDGSGPRSRYARSRPDRYDLGVSDDPTATLDDPPSHAARTGAGS